MSESTPTVLTEQDYQDIFESIESTLIKEASRALPTDTVRRRFDKNKQVEAKVFSDKDYYWVFVYVVFYAGFRAAIVSAREDTIHKHFPDYRTVAAYGESEIDRILDDPGMIRNERKVRACVKNARVFEGIIAQQGSFQSYLHSFRPRESFENLLRLRADLQRRFSYIGPTTSLHVLTEIGMPALKPDVVMRRIFYRLGLTESQGTTEDELLDVLREGLRFSEVTGHPMRYIDIVFVKYGQVRSEYYGIDRGVCLGSDPRCTICGLTGRCRYYDGTLDGQS